MTIPAKSSAAQALVDLANGFGAYELGVRPKRHPEQGLVWMWYIRWDLEDPADNAVLWHRNYDRGALKMAVHVLERSVCTCGLPVGFDQESGLCCWTYRKGQWAGSCTMTPLTINIDPAGPPASTQFEAFGDRSFPDAMGFVRDRLGHPFRWRPLRD